MLTTRPPIYRCDTNAPGWMNGGHPTVVDGKVKPYQSRLHLFSWKLFPVGQIQRLLEQQAVLLWYNQAPGNVYKLQLDSSEYIEASDR